MKTLILPTLFALTLFAPALRAADDIALPLAINFAVSSGYWEETPDSAGLDIVTADGAEDAKGDKKRPAPEKKRGYYKVFAVR